VCLTVRNENGTDVNCKKIYIATTSSNDELAKIRVGVYPNPCTSVLNVNLMNYYPENARLTLFDTNGRIVKDRKLTQGHTVVAVYDLVQGIYFYRITDKGEILDSGKMMKE
jgi:PKD repeat protein